MMMITMMIRLTRNSGCSKEMIFDGKRRVFYSARGKRKKIENAATRQKLNYWLVAFTSAAASSFSIVVTDFKVSTDSMSSSVGFDPMDIIWEEYVWNIDSYGNKFIRNNKIIKLLRSQWFLGHPRCSAVRPRSPRRQPGPQFVGPAFAPHGPGGLDPEGLGPELGSSGGRAHYSLHPPSLPHHRHPLALASCRGSPGKV